MTVLLYANTLWTSGTSWTTVMHVYAERNVTNEISLLICTGRVLNPPCYDPQKLLRVMGDAHLGNITLVYMSI